MSLPAATSSQPQAVCRAAEGGIGIAIVPDVDGAAAIAEGRLVRVLAGWPPAPIPVTVLSRTNVAPPRRVTALVEFLFEVDAKALS